MKFALIGAAGYWGKNYLRILSQHENVSDILVCDINQGNLDVVKTNYPELETTTSIDDVMKSNCHAAIICTPVKTHYQIARDLLAAGKHILCEKAFTLTSKEAEVLTLFAEDINLKLAVGHTFIFNSCVKYISGLLESGLLGDIYYVNMVRVGSSPVRQDVGCIIDLATHDISMLINWFGMPDSVSSFGNSYLNDGMEDFAVVNFKFPDEVIASVTCSWLHPRKERSVTIVGSEGMLIFDDIKQSVTLFNKDGETQATIKYLQPLTEQVNDFIESIIQDRQPLVGGWDGYSVVKVLESCNQALKQ